eukprot:TRINITY_DN22709_c0_g1_i2.p1 TRINITY_DN22709_c0_g1~~TRINITY_DN22709_c0_g1_i2.p1  ORF type:complete len:688 (-),score=138.02 TRINITY_DN22709_c0_g1_i2:74-2047(-)
MTASAVTAADSSWQSTGSHRTEQMDDASSERLMKIKRQSLALETEVSLTKKQTWSRSRIAADRIFKSFAFEGCMALTVMFNTALMVIEADTDATCEKASGCTPGWLGILNKLLLTIYTLDLAATLYVEQSDFIWAWWNWLDVVIVVSGFAELMAYLVDPTSRSEVTLLRMLRLFRILRMLKMVRVLKSVPELYKLVTGFAYTMRAMLCGFWILISLVFLWAIVTVEIVGPISRSLKVQEEEWCNFAFTSVWHAMLYFFQTLIAGDSWGTCALPLARKHQGTFLLFVAVLVTVQLGFMNLLLSVIVDGAAEARGENDRIASLLKMKDSLEDVERLYEILQSIDSDESGNLSLKELLEGFDSDPNLRERLTSLRLDRESLQTVFNLMVDESGNIHYFDLIDAIKKAEHDDQRLQFMIMKMQIDKIHRVQDSILYTVKKLSGAETAPPSRSASKTSNRSGDRQPPPAPPPEMPEKVALLQSATDAGSLPAAAKATVVLQEKSDVESQAQAAAQACVPLAMELEYLRAAVEKVGEDMQKRLDAMACEGAGQALRFTQLTETLSEALLMIGRPEEFQQVVATSTSQQQCCSPALQQVPSSQIPAAAAKDASAEQGRYVAGVTRGMSTEGKGPIFLSKRGKEEELQSCAKSKTDIIESLSSRS